MEERKREERKRREMKREEMKREERKREELTRGGEELMMSEKVKSAYFILTYQP